MRKNKFICTLSALMMACIIAFSGVGGSYIQVQATSVGIPRPAAWNEDASTWENICRYLDLYMSYQGVYVNPNGLLYTAQDFYDFMMSDGVSHDVAHGIFCDCDDSTHTSFSGNEHGGGGFIRDGISVDDDGNVTYSDDVSDLFHDYIEDYLDDSCGYFNLKTLSPNQISMSFFSSQTEFNNFVDTVENFGMLYVYFQNTSLALGHIVSENFYVNKPLSQITFSDVQIRFPNGKAYFSFLNDDWTVESTYYYTSPSGGSFIDLEEVYDPGDLPLKSASSEFYLYYNYGNVLYGVVSNDGRAVKVWYDIEAYKNYTVNHQPYYVTQNWNNYDNSIDNSMTITNSQYQYYTNNSSTLYETIQNNIDNSSETINETVVYNIVNNTYNIIVEDANNYGEDSGSGGSDDGNGSTSDNDTGSGGTGVTDLIDGIGKIFDTILSLIGKLMGVVADFTQSILDLFSGFTTFTDGFSDFLSGAFAFIPPEVWDIVKVGLSLMVLLAVIKFLRK